MESQTKHRLIGSVVLVFALLLVSVFCYLSSRHVTTEKTRDEPMAYTTIRLPVEQATVSRPVIPSSLSTAETVQTAIDRAPIKKTKPLVTDKASTASLAQAAQKELSSMSLPSTSVSQSQAPEKTSQVKEQWVVQLASFSNEKNAKRLMAQLKQAGYVTYMKEQTWTQGRLLVRVYVGPVTNKKSANQLKKTLQQSFQLTGVVKFINS